MTHLFPSPDAARSRSGEIIVVGFAGGGGSCEGIRQALGRSPEEALNHDPEAVAMHAVNHPETRHHCQNIWQADPHQVANGRPIGLAWFSTDCKHFSKAKGAAPRARNIRDLAWVVVAYARLPRHLRPRVIMLENVEEFITWGPLTAEGQPDAERKGETFHKWVGELKRLGYRIDWRELRACDYGAPTIRKRLFIIARCDGEPIVWPAPTHGPGRPLPYRTAADIIDWSLPCPSIFLTREQGRAIGVNRPLAEATMARIAAGVRRYVIEAAEPFLVPVTHGGDLRCWTAGEPLRTITTANGGEFALVAPYFSTYYGAKREGEVRGCGAEGQLGTQTTENRHALVTAFLAQHNTGVVGHDARKPLSTIIGKGSTQAVVSAFMLNQKGADQRMGSVGAPVPTMTAQGTHIGEVRAFLTKYYGEGGQDQDCRDPLHTVTTKARLGLVTIQGEPYEIADIGMRMLSPRELFRAQGFPESYRIDIEVNGRRLSKAAQIRMCGNSVCPPIARALVEANAADLAVCKEAA